MKVILWNLRKSLLELFPTSKYRLILISLILIAAFISVSELLVAKLFTQIILNEDELAKSTLFLLIGGFFIFYGFTRAGQFAQRIYRLRVFDKAFKATDAELSMAKDNWRWSLAFELTHISSTLTQMGVVLAFFLYINWIFALINLVMIVIVLEVIGRLFKKQIEAQRGFVEAKKNKTPVRNYRDYKATDFQVAELSWLWSLNRGIITPPGLDEQWLISLAHGQTEIDILVEDFRSLAKALRD